MADWVTAAEINSWRDICKRVLGLKFKDGGAKITQFPLRNFLTKKDPQFTLFYYDDGSCTAPPTGSASKKDSYGVLLFRIYIIFIKFAKLDFNKENYERFFKQVEDLLYGLIEPIGKLSLTPSQRVKLAKEIRQIINNMKKRVNMPFPDEQASKPVGKKKAVPVPVTLYLFWGQESGTYYPVENIDLVKPGLSNKPLKDALPAILAQASNNDSKGQFKQWYNAASKKNLIEKYLRSVEIRPAEHSGGSVQSGFLLDLNETTDKVMHDLMVDAVAEGKPRKVGLMVRIGKGLPIYDSEDGQGSSGNGRVDLLLYWGQKSGAYYRVKNINLLAPEYANIPIGKALRSHILLQSAKYTDARGDFGKWYTVEMKNQRIKDHLRKLTVKTTAGAGIDLDTKTADLAKSLQPGVSLKIRIGPGVEDNNSGGQGLSGPSSSSGKDKPAKAGSEKTKITVNWIDGLDRSGQITVDLADSSQVYELTLECGTLCAPEPGVYAEVSLFFDNRRTIKIEPSGTIGELRQNSLWPRNNVLYATVDELIYEAGDSDLELQDMTSGSWDSFSSSSGRLANSAMKSGNSSLFGRSGRTANSAMKSGNSSRLGNSSRSANFAKTLNGASANSSRSMRSSGNLSKSIRPVSSGADDVCKKGSILRLHLFGEDGRRDFGFINLTIDDPEGDLSFGLGEDACCSSRALNEALKKNREVFNWLQDGYKDNHDGVLHEDFEPADWADCEFIGSNGKVPDQDTSIASLWNQRLGVGKPGAYFICRISLYGGQPLDISVEL